MTESAPRSTSSQRSLLAIILLVIFLASVATAWWIVHARSFSAQAVAELHSKTLIAFWGKEPQTFCYVQNDAQGQPSRWLIRHRRHAANGYSGFVYIGDATECQPVEAWTLADDARDGSYSGANAHGRSTEIMLRGGIVQIRLAPIAAESKTPVNYLPEGTEEVFLRMVAQSGKHGQFLSIDNSAPIERSGEILFYGTGMEPLSSRKVRVVRVGPKSTIQTDYTLDDAGNIVSWGEPSAEPLYRRVTIGELTERFPHNGTLSKLLSELEAGTAPPEVSPPTTTATDDTTLIPASLVP